MARRTLDVRPFLPRFVPSAGVVVGDVAMIPIAATTAESTAVRRLRSAVYCDEMGFLPPGDPAGERDGDDVRSLCWGVTENVDDGLVRLVATARLIVKGFPTDRGPDLRPLPVETAWPDAFDEPLPAGSGELSRFVSRHEDRRVQHANALVLAEAALRFGAGASSRVFGMIDPAFERLVSASFRVTRLAGPTWIEQYRSVNVLAELALLDQQDPELGRADRR